MIEEAIAEYKKAVELSGKSTSYLTNNKAGLAYGYAVMGKRSESQKILNELLEYSKHQYIWAGEIALIYAGLDDKDRFFQWFEKAYQNQDLTIDALVAEPLFDPLASDPRFEDLIRRLRVRDSL